METRTIRGIRLAFDWQHRYADLVVFIHGVGANRHSWKPQLKSFYERGYSVAAIDMRGTGDSQARFDSGLAVPISIEEFASDVDALIRDLGYDRAHWIGNSMGGVITMDAMARRLPTLRSAVLCNTFAKHPDSAQILPRAALALRSNSLESFARQRIPAVLSASIDPETLEENIQAMATKDPETYLLSWRATWSNDYRDRIRNSQIPTLVITGSLDAITPSALGEEIAALVPDARYHLIEGAGHISNLDQPAEFDRIVLDFLGSL